MRIRPMTIDDYEQVYALWLSCPGMGLNNLDESRAGIARFLKRNPDSCFVAEEDRSIVGVILAGDDGRRGYLYHTAVSSAHRGRGIGSRLVETALAALKANGVHKVALVVFTRNQGGSAFWEKRGFTLREDLSYHNRTLTELVRIDT